MQTIEDVPQGVAGVHALPTAVGSQLSRGRRAVRGLLRPRWQGRLVVVMDDHVLTGDLTGSARDTEKMMPFAQTGGECRMVGRTPLTQANAAPQRIWEGKPRFLIVLVPGDDQ